MKNISSYSVLIAFLAVCALFSVIGSTDPGICAAERTSSNYSIDTDEMSGAGMTGESSANYKMEKAVAGEAAKTGSAESSGYQVYGGHLNTLGTNPNDSVSPGQYRADGTTPVTLGEWINDDTVVMKFQMSDPDPTNDLTPQVEVKPVGTDFNGVPDYSGAEVSFHGTQVTGIVTADSLSWNLAYHWQARIIDDEGFTSGWVSFGGNQETDMDFGIDMTPPAITVNSPNGGETWEANTAHNILWTAADQGIGVDHVDIYYSTNEGTSWIGIATGIANDGTRSWTVPNQPTTEAMVKIVAVDKLGNVGSDESDLPFNIINQLYPPTNLTANAMPIDNPDHVSLAWTASTSESIDGYNVYRGSAFETYGTDPINAVLITALTYNDNTVSHGNNYYYAVKTIKGGTVGVAYSNDAGAPLLKLTRMVTIDAPVQGGYSGGAHDAVPGAIIKYTINYENIGYSFARNIILNDAIPDHTQYKMGSLTGEAVVSIGFSSDNGDSFGYTPTGTYVDGSVTNISVEAQDLSSGVSKRCTYEVVIK